MTWLGPETACDVGPYTLAIFHGAENASDETFERFIEHIAYVDDEGSLCFPDVQCVLTLSLGGMATTRQRQRIRDLRTKPTLAPVVFITDSRIARAMMTALQWFLPLEISAYPLSQTEDALRATGAEGPEAAHLRELLRRWQSEYPARSGRSAA